MMQHPRGHGLESVTLKFTPGKIPKHVKDILGLKAKTAKGLRQAGAATGSLASAASGGG